MSTKTVLSLSAHTENWWHSRARSLPGKQWRVTQETIAVLASGKYNFKQTSSLFLSFPTGIMKIMMLPSYANSFKGTAQQLFMKNTCYPSRKDLLQESTCWKSLRIKLFFYCFLLQLLRKIFSLVTLFLFLISLDSPLFLSSCSEPPLWVHWSPRLFSYSGNSVCWFTHVSHTCKEICNC